VLDRPSQSTHPYRLRGLLHLPFRVGQALSVAARRDRLGVFEKNGDVIDFDAVQAVTDYASFTQALAGTRSPVPHGERIGGPFFTVPGQYVFVEDARLNVYEYPSRNALEDDRSSINTRGDNVPGGAAGSLS
jgi:hypothetical protein